MQTFGSAEAFFPPGYFGSVLYDTGRSLEAKTRPKTRGRRTDRHGDI